MGGYIRYRRASVRPYSYPDGGKKEIARQLTNRAIVALAARAGCDLIIEWREGQKDKMERSYSGDERSLKKYAQKLKEFGEGPIDFDAWRAESGL